MEGYKPLVGGNCNPYHEDYQTYYVRYVSYTQHSSAMS